MPRIAPVPLEDLDVELRARIEEGLASGMYTNPLPLQIVARSPSSLRAMDDAYRATFRQGTVEPRIHELIRLRSAQLGDCEPCSQSRKDPSVTEDDVACLVAPDALAFDERERLALRFMDLLASDHHAIDDAFVAQLGEVFTAEEVIEIGYSCAQALGGHRLMHVLDALGDGEPVIE